MAVSPGALRFSWFRIRRTEPSGRAKAPMPSRLRGVGVPSVMRSPSLPNTT
jgi:hypothetical protein